MYNVNTATNELTYAIDKATDELYPRFSTYTVGLSSIGHECARHIFYSFRWMSEDEVISPQKKRLLNRGNSEEPIFDRLITQIGFELIKSIDTKQHKVEFCEKHIKGYADGIASTAKIDKSLYPNLSLLPPHVLIEYKTCGTGKGFNGYSRTVILHRPVYYTQMCVLGYGLNLPVSLFFVVNKNDDSIYTEVIELDFKHAANIIERTKNLIYTNIPPKRIANSPSFSVCKTCKHNIICHDDGVPIKNCRSCANSLPTDNKQWICTKYSSNIIPLDYQKIGCDEWKPIMRVQ